MTKLFFILTVLLVQSLAMAKIPLSVTNFEDRSGESHCRQGSYRSWWHHGLGTAFREMLEHSLAANPEVQILERREIRRLYDQEHELVNSAHAKKVKRGEFKQAKYSLVGTVTEYELCDQDSGGSVDVGQLVGFGSFQVGGSTGQAKVVVNIKIINVETGEVIKSVEGEGVSKASSAEARVAISGVRTGLDTRKNDPLNRAAKDAIKQVIPGILDALKI